RQSLLFGGLEAISYNINRKKTDLKFFEFGKTYAKILSGYEEYKHLALFVTGNYTLPNWNATAQPINFFSFKGIIEAILDRLGILKYTTQVVRSEEHTSELQSRENLVCRLLLEKKKNTRDND